MDPDDISFDEEECLSMSQGMSAFCIMGLTFRSYSEINLDVLGLSQNKGSFDGHCFECL